MARKTGKTVERRGTGWTPAAVISSALNHLSPSSRSLPQVICVISSTECLTWPTVPARCPFDDPSQSQHAHNPSGHEPLRSEWLDGSLSRNRWRPSEHKRGAGNAFGDCCALAVRCDAHRSIGAFLTSNKPMM